MLQKIKGVEDNEKEAWIVAPGSGIGTNKLLQTDAT
jgi:2-phospho-L-lactate guanylyltransferase (CobY/MobA/RfbA family)